MPSYLLTRKGIISGLVGAMIAASVPQVRAQENSDELSGVPYGVPELVPLVPLTPPEGIPHSEEPTTFESVSPPAEQCADAQTCFTDAMQNFNDGNFEDAASQFLRAYDLAPEGSSSILLFNAAVAYEHAGLPDNAIRFYQDYLEEVPNAVGKTALQNRFGALEQYARGLGLLDQNKIEPALNELIGVQRDLGTSNPPVSLCGNIADAYERSGQTKEALTHYRTCLKQAERYPAVKAALEAKVVELTSAAPQIEFDDLDLRESTLASLEEVSVSAEPSFPNQHRWGLVTGGFGMLALGTGVVLNYAGNARFKELARTCGQTPAGCSQSDIDGLKAYFTGRNASYVVGGIAVAAAVALFIAESLNNPKPEGERSGLELRPDGTLALGY